MMKNHLVLRGFVDNLVIDEKPKNRVNDLKKSVKALEL
jgi:hypothetical protein